MLRDVARKAALRAVMDTGLGFGAFKRVWGASGYEYADFLRRHGRFHSIGTRVLILPGTEVTDPAYVRIGNNVCLSQCALIGHDGSIGVLERAYGVKLDRVGKIDIRDNVFVGYGAIVLPGVTIGPNSVVAAGAVVTKDVEEGWVVAGVPAKPVLRTEELVRRFAADAKELPWWELIAKRTSDFDPLLEPELIRRRVQSFYPNGADESGSPNHMRITFVLPPLNHTGGIRVLAAHAERLRQRGHQVTVVTTIIRRPSLRRRVGRLIRGDLRPWKKRHEGPNHFENSRIDLRELPHAGPVTDADVPDADVVVATWWETAPMVLRMSPKKGRKVYFLQGFEPSLPTVPTEEAEATWRLPLRKIVVAEWLAKLAKERFDDPTALSVPNSVDTTQFFAEPRGKRPVPTVGFIYVDLNTKGTDIAIQAIVKAKERVPNLRAICFGILTPSPNLPIPSWFEFTQAPPQDVMRSLYASCDVFLQASRIEGFGLPILEAMACRTPVIATPAGAGPELTRPGGGKLVGPENPDEMAAAIVEIANTSDAEWRAMSDAAYRTATTYTWDDAAAAFESALKQILSS